LVVPWCVTSGMPSVSGPIYLEGNNGKFFDLTPFLGVMDSSMRFRSLRMLLIR
jgi:hypothetical protein